MIGIVDIEMGNLRSVENAVHQSGHDSKMVRRADDFEEVTHLILPGVGAFRRAMERIAARDLRAPIQDHASRGWPLLGICLGMQLLGDFGEEGGASDGLGLIRGRVIQFDRQSVPRVPHVGWNDASVKRPHPIWKGVRPACDFYFVHSYHFVPGQSGDVLATLDYGAADYTAAIARENIVGLQFHPEKSQRNGLRLIENFCQWDGRC